MEERTYEGGWDDAIARYEGRRAALDFAPGEAFPPADLDLGALRQALHHPQPLPERASGYAKKRAQLGPDCAGQSELVFLHALCIAALRKRGWPEAAPILFLRLWREEAQLLLGQLSTRWLISAAITFADHGECEAQRRLGQSLKVLFSLLKLTEFERLFSGLAPQSAFKFGQKSKAALPMGLEPFALRGGGLDINLLAPLVQEARQTPVLGPLALELLDRLNADDGTIFRRLKRMREVKEARSLL